MLSIRGLSSRVSVDKRVIQMSSDSCMYIVMLFQDLMKSAYWRSPPHSTDKFNSVLSDVSFIYQFHLYFLNFSLFSKIAYNKNSTNCLHSVREYSSKMNVDSSTISLVYCRLLRTRRHLLLFIHLFYVLYCMYFPEVCWNVLRVQIHERCLRIDIHPVRGSPFIAQEI